MTTESTQQRRLHALRIGLWPALVIALIVAIPLVISELERPKAVVGQKAPDFVLKDLSGRRISLADTKGRPVMLNFWTTWCPTCRATIPVLDTFARRYGDKVTVLGVNIGERREVVRELAAQMDVTYQILLDEASTTAETYQISVIPQMWFIDESGIARNNWRGSISFEELRTQYRNLTGRSIDGARVPGEAVGSYRLYARNGFCLYDRNQAWCSADGGANWATAARDLAPGLAEQPRSVAWANAQATAWVEGKGLYYTANNGGKWHPLLAAHLRTDLPDVALELSARQIWTGTNEGLWVSDDRGINWQKLSFHLPVLGLAVDPRDEKQVWLATPAGVWVYDGQVFRLADGSPVRRFDDIEAVALPDGDAMVAVAPNGDVYRIDGKSPWQLLNPE